MLGGWSFTARNVVLAAGFVVIVLGALADIAQFVDGREGGSQPATVLLQQDNAGPPLTTIAEVSATPLPAPLVEPTVAAETFFDPVFNTHTVESGDVLFEIASRYGTTTQVLIELNSIEDPNRIEVGQVLALPEPSVES